MSASLLTPILIALFSALLSAAPAFLAGLHLPQPAWAKSDLAKAAEAAAVQAIANSASQALAGLSQPTVAPTVAPTAGDGQPVPAAAPVVEAPVIAAVVQ